MKVYLRLVVVLVVPILVAALTYLFMHRAFLEPVDPSNTKTELVEIEPEKTFREICKKIQSQNIIRHWWALEVLARVKKSDTAINAGEYELSPSMSPKDVLKKLVSGDVFKRKVLVKEGASIWEIGAVVQEAGLMPAEEFNKAVADAKLLAVAGLNASSFEGYLFPNTYNFSRPASAKTIIFTMLEEGEKQWPGEFTQRADELHLTRHEILTLASIIEKESGDPEEMPIISSVFHNRLNQGMKLQSDPTVIYGLKNFDGNLTKENLQDPHPYNTYVNFGLPPGPIGNPGKTAVRAALFPKETSYLFFVANRKGGHVFSTTLQEHNDAVHTFQLGGGG